MLLFESPVWILANLIPSMIYIGQKIQYTGRKLPNVLVLACWKADQPADEDPPKEEEKPSENEADELRERVKELESIIQKVRDIVNE